VTKEKADLEKQLEAAKKSTASSSIGSGGSSDEITKLKKTIEEKDYEISGLDKQVKNLQKVNALFNVDEEGRAPEGLENFKTALASFFTGEPLEPAPAQVTYDNLDRLLTAMGYADGLGTNQQFAALKNDKNVAALDALLTALDLGDVKSLKNIKEFKALQDANPKNVAALKKFLGMVKPGGVTSLSDINEFAALKGDNTTTVADLNTLLNAIRNRVSLDKIAEFAALKTEAESDQDDLTKIGGFATALETVLTALGANTAEGKDVDNLIKYLKTVTGKDKARNVDELKKFLGNDLPVYTWAGDGDLKVTTGAGQEKQVKNGANNGAATDAEIMDMLKSAGTKFIVIDNTGKLGHKMHNNEQE
jgi:hypothetical protein